MKTILRTSILSLAILGAACSDRMESPTLAAPEGRAEISDAAHGGAPGFWFLPPMLPQPEKTGAFDADLAPKVSLCLLRGGQCGRLVAEYTRTFGIDGARVEVKASQSHYLVNWDTRRTAVETGDTVRIAVSVAAATLGFADVVLVDNGAGAKNVDTGEFIPLLDGRTLPIKFRIDAGIAGSITVTPGVASVTKGGSRQYRAEVKDLHGNVLPNQPVSWSAGGGAAISPAGMATGTDAGTWTITATSGRLRGAAALTVSEPAVDPEPELQPETPYLWTPAATGGQGNFGVWGSSASDVYMANWVGVWHFDGSVWAVIPELEWHGTLDVYGFGADDVWAVGPNGRILRYDGTAWSGARYDGDSVYPEPLGVWENPRRNLFLWGVWGASPNDVFVAGDSGTVLHWNGSAWSRMATGTNVGLRRVWGTSGSDVYVSGEAGTLLHYDGTAWTRVTVPATQTLARIWGSSANDVYVGGAEATLLHWDGTAWSRVALPIAPTATVHAVWGTSADNLFVAGSEGFVLRWDGARWVHEVSGRPEQILALWGASGTDVFAAMSDGRLARR